MTLRLIERLNAIRQRYFVGRDLECELFRSMISAPELPYSIVYLSGSGGVGKTTLLWQFAQICQAAEIPIAYLDGRMIDPDQALRQAELIESSRSVLLIDHYDCLLPIESWFQNDFLPELPEQMLVVLAGRQAPNCSWRTDPGWKALFHSLALQPFNLRETCLYLDQRSIPSDQHLELFNFTQGHPLALSLIADLYVQNGNFDRLSDARCDVIQALLETFLTEVPSLEHRMALEACVVAQITTEPLLAELLEIEDGHERFEWLRELSFIEMQSVGLVPHQIVREVIICDLRWRNPERLERLQHRAFSALTEHSISLSQTEFLQALRDAFRNFSRPDMLQRNPLVRSRFVIRADRADRIMVLRSRLQAAADLLRASPRDEKFYWVLHHTYLQPALTQEQAAELLDLPFSTYRRYLKTGISRVADILWQQEVLAA